MGDTYAMGELFVYANGDRWELGMVKRPNNTGDGYFCWYSTGDTAANTPTWCMHKLANCGFTKIEGLLLEYMNKAGYTDLRVLLSATIDADEAPERASLQAEIGAHQPEDGSPLPRD